MSVRKLDSFTAFVFGLIVATCLHWMRGGRRELEWHDEQRLRDDIAYWLSQRGIAYDTARNIAAKVPRAWL